MWCIVVVFVARTCFYNSLFFCFKQKTAYEMRISDWSSDVCSSDLHRWIGPFALRDREAEARVVRRAILEMRALGGGDVAGQPHGRDRRPLGVGRVKAHLGAAARQRGNGNRRSRYEGDGVL